LGAGWVNAWYLAGAGFTEDRTSDVVHKNGGIPGAASMDELTATVLATLDDTDSTVTVASSSEASVGEQVVDVFPAEGDDSVRGYRLYVFGQREAGSGPYSLYAVERTLLCWRGVDPTGLCI
ncbi:MAG: hypothetical protein ACR2N7_06850, partial [Acidimicrobiia bacterium]